MRDYTWELEDMRVWVMQWRNVPQKLCMQVTSPVACNELCE